MRWHESEGRQQNGDASSSLAEEVIWDRGRGRGDKLGEVARVSDLKPEGFAGVAADSEVEGHQ
jgi:hypothetical protein